MLKKGLITEEDLKQAREEDKQKAAAEESRRDAIVAKIPKWLDSRRGAEVLISQAQSPKVKVES